MFHSQRKEQSVTRLEMYNFNILLRFIRIEIFCWQLYSVIVFSNTHLSSTITRTDIDTEQKFHVRLLCVDTNYATVQWGSTENKHYLLENNLTAPASVHSIEWNNAINLTLTFENITIKEDFVKNSNCYTFRNLQSKSGYNLIIDAKSVDGKKISTSLNFSTASENIKHQRPTKFEVERLINISNTHANILVEWEPAKDFPACRYNISWSYLLNTSSTVIQCIDQVKNRKILENFVYNVCYNFSLTPIYGKEKNSTNEARIESFCPMPKGHNMSGNCICSDQTCTVTINWEPVNVTQGFIETSISSFNQTPIFKNVSKTATSIVFSHLEISDNYEFHILTNAANGPYRVQFLANPNSACLLFVPNAPYMEDIRLKNEKNKSGFCDVTISWTDYYTNAEGPDQVVVEIMQPEFKIFESFDKPNITGETIILRNLTLGSDYQMEMSVIFNQIIVCKYFWKNLSCSESKLATIIEQRFDYINVVGILAGMAMAWTFVFALLCFHKLIVSSPNTRKKIYKIQVKNKEYNHLIKKTKHNRQEYCKLILGDMLGSGAFGVVFKGILILNNNKEMKVAVKTLRNNASQKEIAQLKKEILLMENVGIHKNIVSIIGSSCDEDRPLLIVEYCPLGDLHAYLRKNYEQIRRNLDDLCDKSEEHFYKNFASYFEANNRHSAENKLYGLVSKGTAGDLNLTFCDLLSFARQVAVGMEYLVSNYVVHRDLAARNILLIDNKIVKISDFGLSRDIYTENIYRITGKGERMPIKWMALESICLQEFTTQTDVWSFGVFLWELFSLGEEPYAQITSPEALYFRLKEGNRLDSPPLAVNDLYDIMLHCWHEIPEIRPSFSTLREILDDLLKTNTSNQYLPLTPLYQQVRTSI